MTHETMKKRNGRRGQGMTEYIIVIALIAIAAIGIATLFGNNIRKLFGASAEALAGNEAVQNTGQTANRQLQEKNLASFGENDSD
jgi:Flp pilus assembly pilin Flp